MHNKGWRGDLPQRLGTIRTGSNRLGLPEHSGGVIGTVQAGSAANTLFVFIPVSSAYEPK